jgi:nicotinamide phosphoribosyltransferase
MKKVIEKRKRTIIKKTINEDAYIKHLLKTYPIGILSMVSDTFNIWDICTKYLPKYKEEILARDGKLVIRPDSGDPCDIVCGYNTLGDFDLHEKGVITNPSDPAFKGVIELLWDVFGGTINEQGYKVLDPHIGAIYGDSITLDRAEEICRRLESKGFASTNIVLGVGSFTYQFNTRDTFGFAMKATYVEVEEEVGSSDITGMHTRASVGREIFKNPITDDGTKKSATGLLRVIWDSEEKSLKLLDKQTWEEEEGSEDNLLQTIYKNGEFIKTTTLTEIRETIKNHI